MEAESFGESLGTAGPSGSVSVAEGPGPPGPWATHGRQNIC